jgi:integrase
MGIYERTDPRGRRRYDIEFVQHGKRVYERTPPGTTKAQARERETALRRGLYDQTALGKHPEILLREAVQAWLNTKPHKHHRNVVSKANLLAPFIGDHTVGEAPDVARLAQEAWSQSLSAATINRRLAILKAALTWYGRPEIGRQIKLRRESNAREVYLSRAQVWRLRSKASNAKVGAAIMVAAYSGLRASEILGLKADGINANSLTVPTSKNGRPRVVPVPGRLLSPFLRELPLGISYDYLHKEFCKARDAAGLGREVTFHCLRHTYASWMINAGVDILTLSKLLGHSSVTTTQRYAHLYDQTLRKAVKRLK